MQAPQITETYVIPSGGKSYAPLNQATYQIDNGAAFLNSYSATYSDYGLPSSTVLTGSDYSPLEIVAYNYSDSPATNIANLTTGQYSVSTSLGSFTLSAAANASGGNTVYTGTFSSPSGASNGFAGFNFTVSGFTNAQNTGTFVCTASTTTSITLANANGVSETHAATALDLGNTYHFASADATKTTVVTYSFNNVLLQDQDTYIVNSGAGAPGYPAYSLVLSQQYYPASVTRVQYWGEYNSKAGQSFTQVGYQNTNGGVVGRMPVNAGEYFAYNSVKGIFGSPGNSTLVVFCSADAGEEVLVTWSYDNQSSIGGGNSSGGPAELLNFSVYTGALGQAANTTIETGGTFSVVEASGSDLVNATKTFQIAVAGAGTVPGYSGIAHVDFAPMYFGDAGQTPSNMYEVMTADAFGGGILDCNPIVPIYDLLTNTRYGLGDSFPASVIDNSSSGSWGGAMTVRGQRYAASAAWNWFASNNYFISPYIDNQDTAASVMSKWLEAGQCAGYMSEGLFKLVPYGSTSTAGNGYTWIAPSSYVVALDDTCFLDSGTKDRIKIERSAWEDAYNKVQISYDDRTNQYFSNVIQEWDQAAIDRFGERLEDPQNYDFIHTQTAAIFAASMRVKRMTSIRNTYTFRLSYAYSYLEPMDVIEVTTSSIWAAGLNNTQLGITNLPMRITKIVDNPAEKEGDGPTLEITCEDYIAPALQPALYNKGLTYGTSVNLFELPGDTEAILFEATSRLTGYTGNQIWIGACGQSSKWGSCNVYVSQDGDSYQGVGTITAPARIGTLVTAFPSSGTQVVSSATTVTNNVQPYTVNGALSGWVQANTVTFPGTAEFEVVSNGGIVDVLMYASLTGSNPNGYMFRFDARSGSQCVIGIATNGTITAIGSAPAGIGLNPVALSGAYTVACTVSTAVGGGLTFDLYLNGILVWTATDSTYTPTGALYYGYEVVSNPVISPTSGSDPSYGDELVVQLEPSCPTLDSGTDTDADFGNTLCFVDGEIIAYSTCTATATDQYTMSGYIRRGQKGSQIESHVAGAAFMRLDSAVFKYTYDPKWAGQTVWFKFQSVNRWNNSPQNLANVQAVAFTVPGLGPGSIDAASGITINQTSFNIGAGPMSAAPTAIT